MSGGKGAKAPKCRNKVASIAGIVARFIPAFAEEPPGKPLTYLSENSRVSSSLFFARSLSEKKREEETLEFSDR